MALWVSYVVRPIAGLWNFGMFIEASSRYSSTSTNQQNIIFVFETGHHCYFIISYFYSPHTFSFGVFIWLQLSFLDWTKSTHFWKQSTWIIDKISLCVQPIIGYCMIRFCLCWSQINSSQFDFWFYETWPCMVTLKYWKILPNNVKNSLQYIPPIGSPKSALF